MLRRAWSHLQAPIPPIFTTTIYVMGTLTFFRMREQELPILSNISTHFSKHRHLKWKGYKVSKVAGSSPKQTKLVVPLPQP